ncbi:MAG: M55 family metallopeptidase [Candidatus Eremiobacteraeota bacterium]|nr:M55 family metallopeptidase [Candidatus Eremiobacteraeota bacterium]
MSAHAGSSLFVSADMEGCATLVHWDEVRPGASAAYRRACRVYTDEVKAAVLGAFDAGYGRAVVNDAHSKMRNLLPEQLSTRVELVSGSFKPHYMLQGLAGGGFAGAFFVGYHGAVGDAEAVMGHTYSPRVIFSCRLQGETVSELAINAALSGEFDVPVRLVSGDEATVAEARRVLPWAVCVETKRSLSYYAADCLSPSVACAALRTAAAEAARSTEARPLRLTPPISLEVDTRLTSQADAMGWVPGFERLGPRTVAFRGSSMLEAYRALMTIIYLGSTA